MHRRRFLLRAGGFVSATAIGLTAVGLTVVAVPLAASRFYGELTTVIQHLQQLQGKPLTSTGQWSVSEIFQHLTQSVQGSYLGYPQLRASWFRHSIGPVALTAFKALGRMQHPLDETIPGMPDFVSEQTAATALAALIEALQRFEQAQQLQPHFAYGLLDHADFACAHRLHIEAHLQQILVG